jgi:hypothetical protein
MSEIIKKIEEFDKDYAGYKITTDKQIITFSIYNNQCCCESYGYLSSDEFLDNFIGAELLSIKRVESVDGIINSYELNDLDCGDAIFINVETSEGLLQFAVYNAHNGYYGHSVKLESMQLKFEDCI